jgi:hypothetical protein
LGQALQAVLFAGLLAGTLDIAAAFVVYGLRGATPLRILIEHGGAAPHPREPPPSRPE